MAGVFATHETHKSWIIFRKCKTSNGSQNTVTAGTLSTSEISHASPDLDDDILLSTLDPDMRPATPDMNDPRSVEMFEEHKQLAKEYLKMQTEIVLQTQKKNELLALEAEEERLQRVLRELQKEKESLRLVRNVLQQQIEEAVDQNVPRNSSEGWVMVSRQNRPEQQ